MELDVGELKVESEGLPVEIDFHLKDVDFDRRKSHLCIDGVSIRPSFTVQERITDDIQINRWPPRRQVTHHQNWYCVPPHTPREVLYDYLN
jgi:hypothetical protein